MSKSNKNPLLRKFGNLVRDARIEKDLSQEELGFELDLHRTYIGMIEKAERNISFAHALKLIQYLNIDIKELYVKQKNLRQEVPLPAELTLDSIYKALEKTQDLFSLIKDKTGVALSKIIQSNNFSGIVSNVFTKMLDECSPYKAFSDQRYPDLKNMNNGIGLEVKASNKPLKGGEGHNGHSGWHIVICFVILENGNIDFSQVEIANLIGFEQKNSDWKYQGSKRNENDSQRTETYITTNIGTAKLRDGTIYLNPEYCTITDSLKRNRRKIDLKIPHYSIFAE